MSGTMFLSLLGGYFLSRTDKFNLPAPLLKIGVTDIEYFWFGQECLREVSRQNLQLESQVAIGALFIFFFVYFLSSRRESGSQTIERFLH